MSYNTNGSMKQFHRSESMPNTIQRLVEMLDHVEERVELLREHASSLEHERETLLQILSSVKSHKDLQNVSEGEREEIEITHQRLLNRTLTVEVSVSTPRNQFQQKALNNVNKLYDDLLNTLKLDCRNSKTVLQQYINACLSDCKGLFNQKFQAAILECTADDQKKMRKKLETLMKSLPSV